MIFTILPSLNLLSDVDKKIRSHPNVIFGGDKMIKADKSGAQSFRLVRLESSEKHLHDRYVVVLECSSAIQISNQLYSNRGRISYGGKYERMHSRISKA